MKFVVFGLTVSSSWGNGHATLWRALLRALARRGHHVVFFERDVPYYAAHRDLYELPQGQLVLFDQWDDIRTHAHATMADADVAIVTSYCPDAIAATDLMCAANRPLKVFYDLDTPVTLDRVRAGETVGYLGPGGLREFDLVLSYTGGRALDELQTLLGARRVAPLYGSVDPTVHHPVAPDVRFRADLSYLGTYADDRQQTLEALFVETARRALTRRFLIGGAQYPQRFPWTENIFFVRHVAPAEHPAFFSSSRLTLNVTRAAMKNHGHCPSGRLFEAAACGSPILTDSWDGLDNFFTPGDEVLIAQSTDDAVAALEFTDQELQTIARRARVRTLEQHTADHRARELEDIFAHAHESVADITKHNSTISPASATISAAALADA